MEKLREDTVSGQPVEPPMLTVEIKKSAEGRMKTINVYARRDDGKLYIEHEDWTIEKQTGPVSLSADVEYVKNEIAELQARLEKVETKLNEGGAQ